MRCYWLPRFSARWRLLLRSLHVEAWNLPGAGELAQVVLWADRIPGARPATTRQRRAARATLAWAAERERLVLPASVIWTLHRQT